LSNKEVVFSTPWFQVVAKKNKNFSQPYYIVDAPDCVSVFATTIDNQVLLVQQYRPTLDSETLELPSGHIEKRESSEEAARRELLEETGYEADRLELLGAIATDTGRLGYKLWCYFAPNVIKVKEPEPTDGIKLVECSPDELMQHINNGVIIHAQDIAALFLSVQKGKLVLNDGEK
jgi:ADP-ribose pyrophosphatase